LIEYSSNSWIIIERAPGYSLKEFIDRKYRNNFGILEAVKLVKQLLIIVKRVHSQGILHRNLEPKHIMIEWDFATTTIEQAHLTLINFSNAYIRSDRKDPINSSSKQSWYKPPQTNVESSIDVSGICAVLFWLITETVPQHGNDTLPHQQSDARDQLESKIIEAVNTARKYQLKYT
jgi:serine/threonine protein kinase